MEHGDLAVSVRPHYVIVLEGVLATVEDITSERRFRPDKVVGINVSWHDLALRRFVTLQRQYPDVGAEVITFTRQSVADFVGDYFAQASIPYSSLSYQPFDTWVSLLPFRDGLQAVYDSDPDRLDRYGQIGKQVLKGEDFV
jgi:hypothetical protein